MSTTAAASAGKGKMPRQIPYIIGNEACERFSFYGMRNILVQFLITSLLLQEVLDPAREAEAKDIMHSFMIGVYFFPLLGGWLADKFFGKYHTILWFSLVYCAGHACLALFENSREGFFLGLGLIALGAGGIKPLVASFMGDQFDQGNKHLAKVVFDAFYWIINFGSLFASLLIPLALKNLGAQWAFGIPGILMFVATFVFWLGRRRYVLVPLPPKDPDSFANVVRTALMTRRPVEGPASKAMRALGVLIAVGSYGRLSRARWRQCSGCAASDPAWRWRWVALWSPWAWAFLLRCSASSSCSAWHWYPCSSVWVAARGCGWRRRADTIRTSRSRASARYCACW